MANNNENESGKVQVSLRIDPAIFGIVSKLAVDEDRSLTNMIERLLKTSPQVAELLETAEPATV